VFQLFVLINAIDNFVDYFLWNITCLLIEIHKQGDKLVFTIGNTKLLQQPFSLHLPVIAAFLVERRRYSINI